ncbi:MAG: hypothetical protein L0Y36_03455 [Planctomycetales bacterium]|nr:hypothetical protein [Planctomycetales bacterium]
MPKVRISVENLTIDAELFDTPTAQKILEALPLESAVNVWGDEIYFDIPLHLKQEPDAREDVAVGDLGYWPAGPAFCIFFGRTPVSRTDQPRAYSPVNVFGRVVGNAKQFKDVPNGAIIRVTSVEA